VAAAEQQLFAEREHTMPASENATDARAWTSNASNQRRRSNGNRRLSHITSGMSSAQA
jgi:hypothetical protein